MKDGASLQRIIDYCNTRWVETDKASNAPYPTPDMQTGRKMAYNDVLHYARSLLNLLESDAVEPNK